MIKNKLSKIEAVAAGDYIIWELFNQVNLQKLHPNIKVTKPLLQYLKTI